MPGSPKKRARRLAMREAAAQPPYVPTMHVSPLGSPPAYDPRFCEVVLAEASNGHTLGGTAGLIGVSTATLAEWRAQHPEFEDAVARAAPIRQRFYETHLFDLVRRGGDPTRLRAVWFALTNVAREDWRDKPAAEAGVTFDLGALIRRSMEIVQPVSVGGIWQQAGKEQTGQ